MRPDVHVNSDGRVVVSFPPVSAGPTPDEHLRACQWALSKYQYEHNTAKNQIEHVRLMKSAFLVCFNCGDYWINHVKGKCLFSPTTFDF